VFIAIIFIVSLVDIATLIQLRSAVMIAGNGHRMAKVRATFQLPEELVNEARNTVVALSGPPQRLTLTKLVEDALRREITRLRGERLGRQRGKEFPQREDEVRTGRPIGS
jgi:hypothetical protein